MIKIGSFIAGIALTIAGVVTRNPTLVLGGLGLVRNSLIDRRTDRNRATIPSTINALPVVYGETLMGIQLVDVRHDSSDERDMWIVYALCHGSRNGAPANAH